MKKLISILDNFGENRMNSKQQFKIIGGTEPPNPPVNEDKGKPSTGGIHPTDGSSPTPTPIPN